MRAARAIFFGFIGATAIIHMIFGQAKLAGRSKRRHYKILCALVAE
jgi:hypothetical protein